MEKHFLNDNFLLKFLVFAAIYQLLLTGQDVITSSQLPFESFPLCCTIVLVYTSLLFGKLLCYHTEGRRHAFVPPFQEILSSKLSLKHFGRSPDFWGLSEEHLNFHPAPEQYPADYYVFPGVNNVYFPKVSWSLLQPHQTAMVWLPPEDG